MSTTTNFSNRNGTGIVIADGFQIGGAKQPGTVVNTTIVFDPPSLATGTSANSNAIPITGVALGDIIELYPPYDVQGVIYQGSPSSAGNIKISLFNTNANTVDLPSGTWRVVS